MNNNKLLKINELIKQEKIQEAQIEVSKLGVEYHKDLEYLYIRGILFYESKLYYAAVDTLLVAMEFGKSEKIYELLSKIYHKLGNKDLSNKILDINLRSATVDMLKNELSGIYRK
jgi:uncharacterized protein HemY